MIGDCWVLWWGGGGVQLQRNPPRASQGSGSGGEPACPGGVKDPAAAGSQGVNTGRNKLLSAASALGIQVLDREAMPLAREPVTWYQWLILKAALEPKANGDPIKYSYLL